MSYIHRKGIKYLGTEIGTNANTYIFTYKGNNYIKYKPVSDAVEYYDSASGNTNINTLSPNIEYYLGLYKPGTSKPYGLTLSHIPDMDNVFAWISEKDFNAGFNMPAATIRFHSNARLPEESVVQPGQTLDSEYFCNSTVLEVLEENMQLPSVDSLFLNPGYMGDPNNTWRLNDSQKGKVFKQNVLINLHENDDCILTYPETELHFYAQWVNDTTNEHIIYYADSKTSTIYGSQKFVYSVKTPITLSNLIPTKSNQLFLGWVLNKNDTSGNPDYYPKSDFIPKYTDDVYLYAIWETQTSNDKKIVTYYHNGGQYGSGMYKNSIGDYSLIPGSNNVFGKDAMPVRLGYTFMGWKTNTDINAGTNNIYWPGKNLTTLQDGDRIRNAQWEKNTVISMTTTSISPDFQCKGHRIAYTFTPTYNVTCQVWCDTHPTGGILVADKPGEVRIRFINSVGEYVNMSGSGIESNQIVYDRKKDNQTPCSKGTVYLTANQTYYLETMCSSAEAEPTIKLSWEFASNTVTIDSKGGFFYKDTTNNKYNTIFTQQFKKVSSSYVGISAQSNTEPLMNFNGGNTLAILDYISEPTKEGYQFKEWVGDPVEPAFIRPRLLKGKLIHTTQYSPLYDFSVSAKWDNNIHYVKYHGNTSTLGYMSDSEHYYDIESNLWANQYEKFAYINYDLRYGAFTDVEQQNEVLLTHDFIGWDESATRTDNPQYSDNDNFIVDDKIYGTTTSLYAQWQLNHIILPEAYREGFIFMGWYTEADGGSYIGAAGDEYITEEDITLYAHWDPTGLVNIQVDGEWKYAIPYIYTNGEWKRALMQAYSASKWEMGTNLGQNMTNQQLEDL